jgi:hypothetical protein
VRRPTRAVGTPFVTADYRPHAPPFETPLAAVYVATMLQVYPHDRVQNYSITLAERLAKHVAR